MTYQVHTFGCKVNTYDSGLMKKNIDTFGLTSREAKLNQVHILNTCAVTAEATKEAVKMVRRIKAREPLSTIVVTGCSAQVDTDSFSGLPGVDLVIANSHKGFLPQLLDQHFAGTLKEKVFKSNIFKKDDLEMDGGNEEEHTRSFIKIQDGCNSFCTFCVIPFARGKSRSIPIINLVNKINDLHQSGSQEVVLTGVHIGDYQGHLLGREAQLEDLLEEVLKRTKVPRIRLTSLEPIEVSERLLDLYADERMVPHFHMSIQSANSEVLTQMKRKYSQEEVRRSLNQIKDRVKNAFVGMDVIAGFPTETDEQYLDTYQCLSELEWTRLHVFPYSERRGTKAVALENLVSGSVKSERAAKLRELSLHRHQAQALRQLGTVKKVLIQKNLSKGGHGLSRDYWNIYIDQAESEFCAKYFNQEVLVEIIGTEINSKWIDFPLKARLLEAEGGRDGVASRNP